MGLIAQREEKYTSEICQTEPESSIVCQVRDIMGVVREHVM
jgi:hypothetical protein